MAVPLTVDQADAVYDVLVEHAGASPEGRDDFVFHQTSRLLVDEYRFVGGLGFGGKFRRGRHETRWYVDCYREDLTPARQAAIDATNRALAELDQAAA